MRVWPSSRSGRVLAGGLLVSVPVALLPIPFLSGLARVGLLLFLGIALTVATLRAMRALLWRVGRRLAFSYFLIGVLPIPMVAALLLVGAYLLSGFFLGQRFRATLDLLQEEVARAAVMRLEQDGEPTSNSSTVPQLHFAQYREGTLVSDDDQAPKAWPQWLEQETSAWLVDGDSTDQPPLFVDSGGGLGLAAAVGNGERGVLVRWRGDLPGELSRRSGAWVELGERHGAESESGTTLNVFSNEWTFSSLRRAEAREGIEEFFASRGHGLRWLVIGLEATRPVLALDGEALGPGVPVSVFAPASAVLDTLITRSGEIDTLATIAFVLPAFLLFDLYAISVIMAVLLILGLSRALNELSRATAAVQAGDFETRIEVRRRDQIGALHRSFNDMTANLHSALGEATAKKILDNELEIARSLQESLLPTLDVTTDRLDVACFFEPSAAIGGDYYDLLPLADSEHRFAIFIADVSGHGIPAALRTSMLKAALVLLVQENQPPSAILPALDQVMRSGTSTRGFVTATLAVVDLEAGRIEITNAGHPPTYLLRDAEVSEIVLPGPPLGALDQNYGHQVAELREDDVWVWLSDGLIEARSPTEQLFGYERTTESLSGSNESASAVRDRLIESVHRHVDGRPPDDDRTMVVVKVGKLPHLRTVG